MHHTNLRVIFICARLLFFLVKICAEIELENGGKIMEKKEPILTLEYVLEDGRTIKLPVYDKEDINDSITSFANELHTRTKEDPESFGYTLSKHKCPKCGKLMYEDEDLYWCRSCFYEEDK